MISYDLYKMFPFVLQSTNLRRRVNTLSHPSAPPYGRHSDYYHSNIGTDIVYYHYVTYLLLH